MPVQTRPQSIVGYEVRDELEELFRAQSGPFPAVRLVVVVNSRHRSRRRSAAGDDGGPVALCS